jgi:hypothetical protein
VAGQFNIGSIYGELRLKAKEWYDGLSKGQKRVVDFARSAAQAFAVVGTAVYAAKKAFEGIIRTTIEYGVQIDKISKVTGVATEEVQRLAYAMEQEHGSIESLQKGLLNITTSLGYAGQELATYTQYFRELGIEYRDGEGKIKSASEIFMELADIMAQGTLTTEQEAAAMMLLSKRAYKDLVPALQKGSEWFNKMGDEAETLRIVLDDEMIKSLKQADDNMTKLSTATKGLKIQIGVHLIPIVDNWVTSMNSLLTITQQVTWADLNWSEKMERVLELIVPFLALMPDFGEKIKNLQQRTSDFVYTVEEAPPALRDFTDEIEKETKALNEEGEAVLSKSEALAGLEIQIPQVQEKTYDFTAGLMEEQSILGDIVDKTYDYSNSIDTLGGAIGRLMGGGGFDKFIKGLFDIALALIPGGTLMGGITKGLFGGLFAEGGVAIPRGARPLFAAEGMVAVNQPTMSPRGNVFGEAGTEVFMRGEQFRTFLQSMTPQVIVHEAGPNTWVQVIKNMPQGDMNELARVLFETAQKRHGALGT